MTRTSKQIVPLGLGLGAFALGCYGLSKLAPVLKRSNKWVDLDFAGQVVLISGGSRGLGLELARAFVDGGCHVALCARSEGELGEAKRQLEERAKRKGEIETFAFDLSEHDAAEEVVKAVTQRFGRIDILVNNAGLIEVSNADAVRVEDFERAMELMFFAHLRMTMAVLPQMRGRRSGHMVNISSVGGIVSIPRLIPYCSAKYALAGLSEGLSVELRRHNIRVLTVFPGLLRTGSFLKAKFKGDVQKEYGWFGLGASLPVISQSAEQAARKIVESLRKGKDECITSWPAQVLALAHGVAPEVTRGALRIADQVLLPNPSPEQTLVEGHDADAKTGWLFRLATVLGRKAAADLNEQTARM